MSNYLKITLFLCLGFLVACGESETPNQTSTSTEAAPADVEAVAEAMPEAKEKVVEEVEVVEEVAETAPAVEEVATQLPAEVENVVTAVEEKATEVVEEVKEEMATAVEAVAGDKPYQLVDGAISANVIEGWKTYNGGGCGGCHGQGGKGAVGPNLAESANNLSKDEFLDVIVNGRAGTFMKPHKSNKRVMDNLENLYAYFVARGDDVLGPGNLIKLPLGK